MIPELIVAGCLATLAIAHSFLGETDILRPLFAAEWSTPLPRWAAERILRFAWHLTSIAWLALAGIVVDGDPLVLIAAMSLASAAMIFVMLRGHLAWPLFLLAGLAALHAGDHLGTWTFAVAAAVTALVLLGVAGLHIYWAGGGRWMLDRALPDTASTARPFSPGPLLTLAVALALASFAALIVIVATGVGPTALRWLVGAGVGVFVVRAVGDTKVAGFTKTVRGTPFADADDRWFTPLVVFLALGASGALLI